ncbi:HNH endonuclease [Aeromicrobium sp. CTD01-1L150]|uniref:HNH endonuclease n=1 Tax=Aeromicrobium sp. CTD01-1L150 TaxID=3341830 RepID=UPI0035C0BCE3
MKIIAWVGVIALAVSATGAVAGPGTSRFNNRFAASAVEGVHVISGAAASHPKTAASAAAIVALLVFVTSFSGRESPSRDPQRLFTVDQRRIGFDRAEGRCEFTRFGLFRCRRPAEHADHWHPWSRGGASDMANLVAACSGHNLRKSDAAPTRWQTALLEWRRRSYFPVGTQRTPGADLRTPPRPVTPAPRQRRS